MENERLAHAIARIELAAAKLDDAGPLPISASSPSAGTALKTELESMKAAHKEALDDRDRTLAKLRADFSDIGKLKDEEIGRLRSESQRQGSAANSAVSEAEYQSLKQKYDQLRKTAESTLAGLDGLIDKAERAENG
jgi:Skp family chaperone for outer membrane proteins